MIDRSFSPIVVIAASVLVLAVAPSAFAGKGGSHGNGTTSTSSSLSLAMVSDQNGDGAPNWNDEVTFDVSTTATDRPYVLLNCYQSGTWVYTMSAGFFPESPWAPNFTLASAAWASGAADCTATLYMVMSNGKTKNLASLSFHVGA